jgi:hypothetical protein
MREKQRSLPLGFGPVHWEGLPPEIRARVLDLWIQLLRHHVERQDAAPGAEEAP